MLRNAELLAALILSLVFAPVAAGQGNSYFSGSQRDQIQDVLVQITINNDNDVMTRYGVLLTASGMLLTVFEPIDTGIDYHCSLPGHSQVQVTGAALDTTYLACLEISDFFQNFAVLRIEADASNAPVEQLNLNISPLLFDYTNYLVMSDDVVGTLPAASGINFEAADVVGIAVLETDGGSKQRQYLTDIQELDEDDMGSPVLDAAGNLIGIAVRRQADANGTVQIVYVLPMTSLCRINAEVCALIVPDDHLPPAVRTSPFPENAVIIDSGEADLEAFAARKCATFGLSGQPADTESGWGCFKGDETTPKRAISIAQIDDLCKETYADLDAFALLSGSDAEKAYQWRCYRPAS